MESKTARKLHTTTLGVRTGIAIVAITVTSSAFADIAADKVAEVLQANQAASGAWPGKRTLEIEYAYSGQGLTGTLESIRDLRSGAFIDSYTIGPTTGASGFDGSHAWEKEASGIVSLQTGGDVRPLAVNESYRNRNSWWRSDRGGAAISYRSAERLGTAVQRSRN